MYPLLELYHPSMLNTKLESFMFSLQILGLAEPNTDPESTAGRSSRVGNLVVSLLLVSSFI